MVERYVYALRVASENAELLHRRCLHNRIFVTRLFRQIIRDRQFGEYSGEAKLLQYSPSKTVIIKALLRALMLTFCNRPKTESIVCVQLNMFTTSMLRAMDIATTSVIEKEDNPILGLKILSYIMAFFIIAISKKRRRIFRRLGSLNDGSYLRSIYVIYIFQIIHVLLVKRYYRTVYYFSLGSPSYGRYISSSFHEVQHGVLHNLHPAVIPVARPKGNIVVSSSFSRFARETKHLIVDNSYRLDKQYQAQTGFACFPSVLPDIERKCVEFASRVALSDSLTVFYHPRSVSFKNNQSNSVEARLTAIQSSRVVITSVSTVIFDAYSCGARQLIVAVTPMELRELGVADIPSLLSVIKSAYGVTLKEDDIALID